MKKKEKTFYEKTISNKLSVIILSVLILFTYSFSLSHDITELDDSILVFENYEYNEDISNLSHSFNRGVFAEKKDVYYRPMLLNSFVINNQLSQENIKGYIFFNILLHLIATLLLWQLLVKINIPKNRAFLLAGLFAIHPTLVQAVSWIPGRNDTLLAIFCFGFIITSINYLTSKKWSHLFLSFILLLAALFTKESAIIIPLGTFILLVSINLLNWKQPKSIFLYASWIIAIGIFLLARFNVGLLNQTVTPSVEALFTNSINRFPALIQYFGKTLLPFNLSVFPMLKDGTILYGILAGLILTGLVFFSKKKNNKLVLAGLGWFLLFVLPVIVLPNSINEQDFEHRLYVPMLGIILILSQSALFTSLPKKYSTLSLVGISLLFLFININRQDSFTNPISFWESAVDSSPNSSYANMMLAARLSDTDKNRSIELMQKAYKLNPSEKYINYYMGKIHFDRNENDQAAKYFIQELEISSYYETYFLLSMIEFERKNLSKSIEYLEPYLEKAPQDQNAWQNYILMLVDTGQKEKALAFINRKQKSGVPIPKNLIDRVNSLQE